MEKNKVILYILYAVLVIVLGYAVYATQGFGLWKGSTANKSDWQAIFLSNGQVYFGKLSSQNSQFVTLEDIYYLQVQKSIQPESADSQGKLTLVKLGNEIHSPEDEMRINRDHIIFIEDMKSDGKVMQSIQKYIDQGPSASGTTDVNASSSASPTSTKK